MSIRLNKALRELNIGLQTAVGFLQRSQLGEVKADPSFKLSDAQYEALVNAFKQDAAVREQAEQLFKKPKEKKPSAKKNEELTGRIGLYRSSEIHAFGQDRPQSGGCA